MLILDSLWSGMMPPRKGMGLQPPAREAPSKVDMEPGVVCVSHPGEILPSEVAGERGAVAGDEAVETGVDEKQGIAEDMVTKLAFNPDNPSGEETEGAVREEAYAAWGWDRNPGKAWLKVDRGGPANQGSRPRPGRRPPS